MALARFSLSCWFLERTEHSGAVDGGAVSSSAAQRSEVERKKASKSADRSGKCLGDSCRAVKVSLSVGVGGACRLRRKHRRLDKLRGPRLSQALETIFTFRAKHEPL